MRRFGALLVMLALLVFTVAWTYEDCVEVNFDHPDCDNYPTTTQPTTTTTEATTTTQPEVTTTTAPTTTTQPEVTTTTQPTTTETQPLTTTTTIPQCPPGTVHQPPLCLTTTVPHFDTTTTTTVPQTVVTLPFTGPEVDPAMLGALASLTLGLGLIALGRSGRNRAD